MRKKTRPLHFNQVADPSTLDHLKSKWRTSLTVPQDGMWEAITDQASHYEIKAEYQTIGYACVDNDYGLLQFFLLPPWMHEGSSVLQRFIRQEKISKGMVGTNNPFCLSAAMHFQKRVLVHTYLFTDHFKAPIAEKKGVLKIAVAEDLHRLVNFCYRAIGGSTQWLSEYLGDLTDRGELFVLEDQGEILGTCEVRKSRTNPMVADVGMIVSPDQRKKGLGTFLLGKAKQIALDWNRLPICSCEKDNIGSLKAIQRNGFRSVHQMLLMEFE